MHLKKIFSLLVLLSVSVFCCGADGELYKLKTPVNYENLSGSAKLAAADTLFRYIPASGKQGVLDTLFLQDYAVSDDQTLLVLAESQEQNGKYLNRLVFIDYKNFQIINGIEKTADKKIDRIFFYGDILICASGRELKTVKINSTPEFAAKSFILPDEISNFIFFKDDLYIKCRDKSLLKLNKEMESVFNFTTRDEAGVIFILPNSQILVNFTDDNIEKIHCLEDGFFRMDFTDLKDTPLPKSFLPSENPSASLFFITDKNELMEFINLSYTEKVDIPEFELLIHRPGKEEIFLLMSKKYSLEIFTMPNFISRKRISHNTMRPKTDRNLKFVIPHKEGVFLITKRGEFVFIKEHKRRLYKEVIQ